MRKRLILLISLITIFSYTPLAISRNNSDESKDKIELISKEKQINFGTLAIEQTEKMPKYCAVKSLFSDNSVSITGQWFLSYQDGKGKSGNYNSFNLKRGYINIKKSLKKSISCRITPDISVDREGDGEGDIELRLKYCYLEYSLSNIGFLFKPYIEFGLVHRPWLDFEEHINNYRVQGTLFLERNAILNSADYGLTFISLIGGEMHNEYKQAVNKSYPGKFGSLALGIYNGGGYHAIEKNQNKTIEGRLSLRPFPRMIPGLQFSYQGVYGKGNTPSEPDWNFNMGFFSWEHRNFVATGLYYIGKGSFKGTVIDPSGKSTCNDGFSLFAELKLPDTKLSIIGRYDYFNQESKPTDWQSKRYILGVAYHFIGKSKILIDYDHNDMNKAGMKNESVFEFAVEVHY